MRGLKPFLRMIVTLIVSSFFMLRCSEGKVSITPSPLPTILESLVSSNALPSISITPTMTVPNEKTAIPTSTHTPTLLFKMKTWSPSLQPTLTLTQLPMQTRSPRPSLIPTIPFSTNLKSLGRIAFANWGQGGSGIDVMNVSGSEYKRLTENSGNKYFFNSPAWSPDGQWIAFSSSELGESDQLFIIGVDGNHLMQLTSDPDMKLHQSWSPDGKRIVYDEYLYIDKYNNSDIYVINRDGTGRKALLDTPQFESSPAWSPDGQMIAYLSQPEENKVDVRSDLMIMNSNGTAKRFVTGSVSGGSQPAWSPDSQQLVIQSFEDCSLYIVNVDGSGRRRLTLNGLNASDPTWSPDGRFIAFNASDYSCVLGEQPSSTGLQIYIISVDGSELMQIPSHNNWNPAEPDWSPVPHLQLGGTYTLTAAGADLYLHESPSLQAKVLQKMKAGDTVIIMEGPTEADYYYWWRMRTTDGEEGWAVDVLGWYAPVNTTITPTLTPTP